METKVKTNQVKELLKRAPYLCGCVEPERVSHMFTLLYDTTAVGDSAFDRSKADMTIVDNRIRLIDLTSPFFQAEKPEVAKKIKALLIICMWSGYFRKGYVSKEELDSVIVANKEAAQAPIPEVDAIMDYSAALSIWWWLI